MNLLQTAMIGLAVGATVGLLGVQAKAAEAVVGPEDKPVGLQLYSLRDAFAKDVPGTLDKVRDFGFKYVELAGTYDKTPEEFKKMLEERGLTAISGHWGYARWRDELDNVVEECRALGVKYAGCAWIDHEEDFDEQECRAAAATFNKAGEELAKHGIRFFYHTHGYEFQPYEGGGTLFDVLMQETKPEFVAVEMDVFWIVHPGQDPATLLGRYPGRFELTHLKDMKKSTETGLLTGHSDVSNCVAIGTGKIDFPKLLAASEKVGIKWHFIEDESPTVEEQIPESLKYLGSVKY
jgi:sugar phosphate isomerase/epimerase